MLSKRYQGHEVAGAFGSLKAVSTIIFHREDGGWFADVAIILNVCPRHRYSETCCDCCTFDAVKAVITSNFDEDNMPTSTCHGCPRSMLLSPDAPISPPCKDRALSLIHI